MARLQRTAWQLAPHALFNEMMGQPAGRKAAAKKAPKVVKRAKAPATGKAPTGTDTGTDFDAATFAGVWKSRIYRTPAMPGVWPVRLSYFVYVPPGLRKGSPVLIMLHGCEQTARDFAVGTRLHRLADREGFLLVYPQQSRRGQQNRCWHWYQPDSAHGYAEADAIAGIAASAVKDYHGDPSRVYIAGLSAGAGMAALAALRHPDTFAALGMHSGGVLGNAHNAGQGLRVMRHGASLAPQQALADLVGDVEAFPGMPAIIVQGDRDVVVDKRNGQQLFEQMAWLNHIDVAAGDVIDAAPLPRPIGAGSARHYMRIDATERDPAARAGKSPAAGPCVSLCIVPGLGHAWSGGDGAIRFHAEQGPDASALMWQFFKTRKRQGPGAA
ncbi:PHB depolymerase family esterase [Bordetella sp. N]|uniref:extracellular catalytic domain type 1 short-chain-length polyhydroxyalkanoate depolymerase n=1 Tax=Bordetella sp. N TaxID=1746199 RepID=UPI0018D2690E|nr:PHB depolymerase family esterase [Bordetella sp. N]